MKTIKCKITNEVDISEYLRKYNSVLHLSYNQIKNGISQSNIKKDINQKFEGLNSFVIQNAIFRLREFLIVIKVESWIMKRKTLGRNLKKFILVEERI